MSSWNETESIGMVELSSYILSKCITSTTWRYSPSTAVIWIRPQEIAHWSFVWNLLMKKHVMMQEWPTQACKMQNYATIQMEKENANIITAITTSDHLLGNKNNKLPPVYDPRLGYCPMCPKMGKGPHANRKSTRDTRSCKKLIQLTCLQEVHQIVSKTFNFTWLSIRAVRGR